MSQGDERQSEIATALADVRRRIARACEAAGRDRSDVTMIAVTKTYPAEDVAALLRLGVLDVGESKQQQAQAKRAELESSAGVDAAALRWHLIGRLQSNKARSVGGFADAVHSLDRAKLVRPLADGAAGRPRALDVFIQVSLDGDPERGGAVPQEVVPLADAVGQRSELNLRGVMAVPPIGSDPAACFARLAEISTRLQADHPQASAVSAGMSADLEQAIAHGSTHVRVGTALLGRRPPAFG